MALVEIAVADSIGTITPRMFEHIQGLRRTVYDRSRTTKKGISVFMEKRKPTFKGN